MTDFTTFSDGAPVCAAAVVLVMMVFIAVMLWREQRRG